MLGLKYCEYEGSSHRLWLKVKELEIALGIVLENEGLFYCFYCSEKNYWILKGAKRNDGGSYCKASKDVQKWFLEK